MIITRDPEASNPIPDDCEVTRHYGQSCPVPSAYRMHIRPGKRYGEGNEVGLGQKC